jgi:hypothetical protein
MGGVSFTRSPNRVVCLRIHTKDTPPFVIQPIHNIRLYLVKDDVTSSPIVAAKLMNVSHVISKFLASEPPTFADVKAILDHAVEAWTTAHGTPPDLTGHGGTFKWDTKADLLAAVGHGKQLIQPGMCGSGQGRSANLIIDLRTGLPQRMPKGGPYLDDAAIQRIEDWINAGCSD